MGSVFVGTNRHILFNRRELAEGAAERRGRRGAPSTSRRSASSPTSLAVILAFVSPYITLAICAGCAIYYSLPVASRGGEADQSGANIA